jgi:hypothetical protein
VRVAVFALVVAALAACLTIVQSPDVDAEIQVLPASHDAGCDGGV